MHQIGPGLNEFFSLINLLIVGLIIYYGARVGIMTALRNRSDNISSRLVEARDELERIKVDVVNARKEVADIEETKRRAVEQVTVEGRQMAQALIADAQSMASRILNEAKFATESELRSAGATLRDRLVKEAIQQSIGLVKTGPADANELRGKIHERLFEKCLADLPTVLTSTKGGHRGN